jgi:multidrug efflux pump subunit AcrB
MMFTQVMLPAGATQERTLEVLRRSSALPRRRVRGGPGAVHRGRLQLRRQGQNMGIGFVRLKDWDERKRPDRT